MSDFYNEISFLNRDFENKKAEKILEFCIKERFFNKIAYVCSFGAESAVILDIISKIDNKLPVIFLNTHFLFNETIEYKKILIDKLKLLNVQEIFPDENDLITDDKNGNLWKSNPDKCCRIRKVLPLEKKLKNFDAWVSGRKAYQKGEREFLKIFEIQNEKIIVNPLINYNFENIGDYFKINKLPRHPLFFKNFLSIGCTNCTAPSTDINNIRSGRWSRKGKTECGIYLKDKNG